jgi:hypothetical protein
MRIDNCPCRAGNMTVNELLGATREPDIRALSRAVITTAGPHPNGTATGAALRLPGFGQPEC